MGAKEALAKLEAIASGYAPTLASDLTLASSAAPWAPFTEELMAIPPKHLPNVLVFDLDDTVWRGDLDRTAGPPIVLGDEQKLVTADGTFVTPFADVPDIFSWIEERGHVAALASAGGQEEQWPGCDCT